MIIIDVPLKYHYESLDGFQRSDRRKLAMRNGDENGKDNTSPGVQQGSSASALGSTASARSSTISSSTASTTPNPISGQTTTPSAVPAKSNNTGAIAGGVIGGVAVLALLVGALWFVRRRANKNRQQQTQTPEQQFQPPFTAPASAHQPGYTVPELHEAGTGTDQKDLHPLDGTERYEIGYQEKGSITRQELQG
ncbi:MAG: hypothetical protein LQ338_004203 [Usnochroma carphineum]|nr:MAG: hypothetical protein LQ338_004203 [Usnochroma carphineum]